MAIDPRLIAQSQVGTSYPTAPRLDPTGIVPVNRTQPVATDGAEAQRLMERRLGSMPPSSFSGAGAGFVPVNRPGSVGNYADQMTAFANREQFAKPQVIPRLSSEAARQTALATGLGAPGGPRANAAIDVMQVGTSAAALAQQQREAMAARKAEIDARNEAQRAAQNLRKDESQARRTLRRTSLQERLASFMAQRPGVAQGMRAGGLLGLPRTGA